MKLPIPFLIALQFLTRLPVLLPTMPTPKEMGLSVVWYPLVGALLGLGLVSVGGLLGEASSLLSAALLLSIWVLLTGGLHLDGLADTADAWIGGFGDKERTLSIMKDPRSGPIAIVVVVMVLLVKFAALTVLLPEEVWALLWALVLGRLSAVALLRSTPYVRSQGLGSALSEHLPRARTGVVLALSAGIVLLCYGMLGLWILAAVGLTFYVLRRAMIKRLGGMTGDTAGALIELTECCVLVAWALY